MWAIGVLTYQLLCGRYPFTGNGNAEIIKSIKTGQFGWPHNVDLSASAKAFIKLLIRKNVRARMCAKNALKDKWFTEVDHDNHNRKYSIDQNALRLHVNNVFSCDRLEYILFHVMMTEINDEERTILLKGFKEIARRMGHNEYIEKGEIEAFLISLKMEKITAKMRTNEIMQVWFWFLYPFSVSNQKIGTF